MDYAVAFSQFLVQSKHRNPSLAAQDFVRISDPSSERAVDKTPLFAALIRTFLSGLQILSYLFNPSIETPALLRKTAFFVFICLHQ
jgi:hypothetical protein